MHNDVDGHYLFCGKIGVNTFRVYVEDKWGHILEPAQEGTPSQLAWVIERWWKPTTAPFIEAEQRGANTAFYAVFGVQYPSMVCRYK